MLTKLASLKHISISFIGSIIDKSKLFGLEWCREFSSVAANRQYAVRCEFNDNDTETNIITTNGRCTVNGELRYCIDYEPNRSQSETHILHLNEKCVDKILEWLPDNDVFSVYQTCAALKKISAKRIQLEVFHFDDRDIPEFERRFNILADDIRKLVIQLTYDNHMHEILTHVHGRCGENLVEFEINYGKTSLLDDLNLSFPNLQQLTIGRIEASATGRILPTIHCPKLTCLEIGPVYNVPIICDFHLGISMDNLTVLKFQYFDTVIAELFDTLSEKICLQLAEFTVTDIKDIEHTGNQLIHMIGRFRNLAELNIIFYGIECTNTVYLFEQCTKLIKLSLGYSDLHKINDGKMEQLLQNCKKRCNNLKVIQLVCDEFTYEYNERMRRYIHDEFPNVQLYDAIPRETTNGKTYEITLWNKPISFYNTKI